MRDLSVDVVITLYGMAAVLIYMMLIGDFMSDIAPWCIPVGNPLAKRPAIGGAKVIRTSRLVAFEIDCKWVKVKSYRNHSGYCSGIHQDTDLLQERIAGKVEG